MVREGHPGSHIQRGMAEALECQDLLERVPVRPLRLVQARAGMVAAVRWLASHQPAFERRVPPIVPAKTVTR